MSYQLGAAWSSGPAWSGGFPVSPDEHEIVPAGSRLDMQSYKLGGAIQRATPPLSGNLLQNHFNP